MVGVLPGTNRGARGRSAATRPVMDNRTAASSNGYPSRKPLPRWLVSRQASRLQRSGPPFEVGGISRLRDRLVLVLPDLILNLAPDLELVNEIGIWPDVADFHDRSQSFLEGLPTFLHQVGQDDSRRARDAPCAVNKHVVAGLSRLATAHGLDEVADFRQASQEILRFGVQAKYEQMAVLGDQLAALSPVPQGRICFVQREYGANVLFGE